jgi:Na+/H+ antiporter NhaC
MFWIIVLLLFIISFLLALKSLGTLNEKPKIGLVKKSLDKNRIIYHS